MVILFFVLLGLLIIANVALLITSIVSVVGLQLVLTATIFNIVMMAVVVVVGLITLLVERDR